MFFSCFSLTVFSTEFHADNHSKRGSDRDITHDTDAGPTMHRRTILTCNKEMEGVNAVHTSYSGEKWHSSHSTPINNLISSH